MSLQARLDEMKNFVVAGLTESGQFEVREPGHAFSGKTIDSCINEKNEEHILAVKRKEFRESDETGAYLILLNAHETEGQKPTEKEFFAKIAAASKAGIMVVPLVYKFLNNEGIYWRRVSLAYSIETDRDYREQPAWFKHSLESLPKAVKDRLRVLSTSLERKWVPSISNGFPVYYQPNSERLDEQLIRFEFEHVLADYSRCCSHIKLDHKILEKTVDPIKIQSMTSFTLRPMRRDYHGPIIRPYRSPVLLGDFLSMPGIKATNDDEMQIQYRLGILHNNIMDSIRSYNLTDYTGLISGNIERLGMMMDGKYSSDGINQLSRSMDTLMEMYSDKLAMVFSGNGFQPKQRQKPDEVTIVSESPYKIYTAIYKSKSKPGTKYTTEVLVFTDMPTEIWERCDCMGSKVWHHCWHRADLKKSVNAEYGIDAYQFNRAMANIQPSQ